MHRRLLLLAVSVIWLTGLILLSPPAHAQAPTCIDYDAWSWAQTVYESVPSAAAALDPDGNGIACDALVGQDGFAPAVWAETIPSDAIPATLVSITDGDTIHALINGVEDTIRLYRTDSPETETYLECGGLEATHQMYELLGYNNNGATIDLQKDVTDRDPNNRYLAYVWITIAGDPYLVNEAMIRSGWASDENYGDELYDAQMRSAEHFAERYRLGTWQFCPTGPNSALELTPSAANAGSGGAGTGSGSTGGPVPSRSAAQGPAAGTDCESSYPSLCIPPAWEVGDWDCGDVAAANFPVQPPDSHGFDRDNDGIGCEE